MEGFIVLGQEYVRSGSGVCKSGSAQQTRLAEKMEGFPPKDSYNPAPRSPLAADLYEAVLSSLKGVGHLLPPLTSPRWSSWVMLVSVACPRTVPRAAPCHSIVGKLSFGSPLSCELTEGTMAPSSLCPQ